ncbi:histidine phosphatase family protein [Desulfosarcina sp.]|uniref:histidine phosphatase family protein n=1 Tax=Desulfosarcina sp. TaxID=2027861 RepID=UPI003566F0AC
MMPKQKLLISGLVLLLLSVTTTAAEPNRLVEQIGAGGHVLMIRHANAPGNGDPDHFRIGDCATQRNLDDRGRAQARRIGQWLRSRGIEEARVYASQWCRCLETAALIDLGPVAELPALNSFYDRPQDRQPNLAALRSFLARQPTDGPPILLVTHFVTISAVTGKGVASGEGVVMRLTGTGDAAVLGQLDFEF